MEAELKIALVDLVQVSVNAALVGLIWLVQVVVYPSYRDIETERFRKWQLWYTSSMGYIAAPLMIGQLGVAIWGVAADPGGFRIGLLVAVALSWVATFAWSVPLHRKLEAEGRDEASVARLIATNWPRTVIWTGVWLAHFGWIATA